MDRQRNIVIFIYIESPVLGVCFWCIWVAQATLLGRELMGSSSSETDNTWLTSSASQPTRPACFYLLLAENCHSRQSTFTRGTTEPQIVWTSPWHWHCNLRFINETSSSEFDLRISEILQNDIPLHQSGSDWIKVSVCVYVEQSI